MKRVMARPRSASRVRAAVGQFFRHWPALGAGFFILALHSAWVAGAWFAVSRIAYVLFVGLSLRGAARHGPRARLQTAWERFRGRASWVMDNDAVAFCALCVVTAGGLPMSWAVSAAAGLLLVTVGVGVKVWATASLSVGSYFWSDFFLPPEPRSLSAGGPYRWLSNPMYTLGYAHLYGVALALRSPAGLAGAGLAQLSILVLNLLVERPHLRHLRVQLPVDDPAGAAWGRQGTRDGVRAAHRT